MYSPGGQAAERLYTMAYSSRLNWPWIALLCSLFKRGIQLHSHGFNLVLFFLLNVSLHLSVMSLPFNPTRRVLRCAQTASNLILRQIVWRRIFFFSIEYSFHFLASMPFHFHLLHWNLLHLSWIHDDMQTAFQIWYQMTRLYAKHSR